MAPHIIVVIGGYWCNTKHEGGIKHYIPIPSVGISFIELLRILEVRMKKDLASHTFEIDGLVTGDKGEPMIMKISNQFEWASMLDMGGFPTVYVSAFSKCNASVIGQSMDMVVLHCDSEMAVINHTPNPAIRRHKTKLLMPMFSPERFRDHDPDSIIVEQNERVPIANGSVFMNKDIMVSAIHAYHMENYVEFRTTISDALRYHVQCKDELICVFSLRGKSFGKSWVLYDFIAHSCERDLNHVVDPKVSARAVADYVFPNMSEDGFVIRPRDIQGMIRRDFGVRVSYAVALRGRNLSLKSLYGGNSESFQVVAKYLYMLREMNPGSFVDLQTCPDDTFQYSYFALAASIRAFRACRPVIVVDATHLKGQYRGVMFVASSKDANEQIVPLAFGIGDKENDLSWKWFIGHVRECFGCPDNLLIISDQHISIKNAVAFVYPGVPHGLCTYHVQGNLKSWGKDVIGIFQLAANAYKDEIYAQHMQNLEVAVPSAYTKLISLDPTRWANCKCPVRRYNFGTSNAVESLNGRLKWARSLPVTSLLEYARNLMQTWFYERRTKAGDRSNKLSVYAEKRLGFAIDKGNSYQVDPVSNLVFNIKSQSQSNVVDLGKKECSCRVFQMDLIPCSHASRAIRYKNQSPASYVSEFYSTQTWREIYADSVMPLPDISDWHIPNDIESRIVLSPPNPNQAGRPSKNRIPPGGIVKKSIVEGSKTNVPRVCSRCQLGGHCATRCTAPVPPPLDEVPRSSPSTEKRKRKAKKCGICGCVGHTRQSCQNPDRFA